MMGLSHRRDEEARNLPYGEQRRLEIARALGTGPKVLLLDEPAAGMNTREKADLMVLIRQLRDQFALGILLIEHDMKLVMGICEQITVLDHGETIAGGTPRAGARATARSSRRTWATAYLEAHGAERRRRERAVSAGARASARRASRCSRSRTSRCHYGAIQALRGVSLSRGQGRGRRADRRATARARRPRCAR